MDEWEKANKCPHCGGRMKLSEHFALTHDFLIRKDGRPCKTYRRSDEGSIDCVTAFCDNCNTYWDGDNTIVDSDDIVYIRGRGTRAYGL